MSSTAIKTTEQVVSCSDNGQHPLVYIHLKDGKGRCQYCGQAFALVDNDATENNQQAA